MYEDTDTVTIAGYDSVGISMESGNFNHVPGRLTNPRGQNDSVTGELLSIAGYANNMKVRISPGNGTGDHCSVSGSLATFHYGDTMEQLTRQETERAIQHLSDTLGLDVKQGRVYRLDIGANIVTKHPAREYCNLLQGLGRYEIDTWNNRQTVQYSLRARKLMVYDKMAERHAKHKPIPDVFQGRNVLRYEARYTARLPVQFKVPKVTCSMLYDPDFYAARITDWENEYFKIRKAKQTRFNVENITDSRILKNVLAGIGIQELGGEQAVLGMLELQTGTLTKMQRIRLRATVRELATDERHTEEIDLIAELNEKVRTAAAYSR